MLQSQTKYHLIFIELTLMSYLLLIQLESRKFPLQNIISDGYAFP